MNAMMNGHWPGEHGAPQARPGEAQDPPAARQAMVGMLEWFRPGEHEQVERALCELKALGVDHLRTGISWADWHTPFGEKWFDWLIERISRDVRLLPCFVYTPPSLGEFPGTNSPPRELKDYGTFVGMLIERHKSRLDWIELWNEPNNMREWAATHDPAYSKFAAMIRYASQVVHHHKKRCLVGGLSPIDPNFISLMHDHGALDDVDAVGLHGFPHSFEFYWEGWATQIKRVRERLQYIGRGEMPVWITEAGYSTWRHDERRQLLTFLDAIKAPVDRVYWYALADLHPELPTVDGFHSDEREYHFGLRRADGTDKLLGRLWKNHGVASLESYGRLLRSTAPAALPMRVGTASRASAARRRHTLITGGAGFIGTNLADRICREGGEVLIYDDLSRPGVERNAAWLKAVHGDQVRLECADIQDEPALRDAVRGAAAVYHFAAQVAVTTSLDGPLHDFQTNVRGTINLLEALRRQKEPPPLVFTSTNKVYGDLSDVQLKLADGRWGPADAVLRRKGVDESRSLDFQSPYGCSKGAADQYVLDWARSYGLQSCVLRMSCIYGPHQFGNEDQGWVAHFVRAALRGETITLYGDGRQVRDILFVEDLVEAMRLAMKRMPAVSGEAFNIGGGPANAVSLRDVISLIGGRIGRPIPLEYGDWRVGDQRYYVSNYGKFERAVDWRPTVAPAAGIARLHDWLAEHVETRRVAGSVASAVEDD